MSDAEDGVQAGHTEQAIKLAKARRAVAKRKFSRKYNLFKEALQDEHGIAVLKDVYIDVSGAYGNLEKCNEEYVLLVTQDGESEEALTEADEYIKALDKMNIEVKCLFKKIEADNLDQTNKTDQNISDKKVKVKPIQNPEFSGDICECSNVKGDVKGSWKLFMVRTRTY